MMKFFSTSKLRQPFMPYFGYGDAHMQPIDVRDVAACFVKAMTLPGTIGKIAELAGPERFTWKELYDICAIAIAGHKRIKIPIPVGVGHLIANAVMPFVPSMLVPFKFDSGQVDMSQEESTANPEPIERHFGIKLRHFREELKLYADQL
jgi:NADH dehydrogenase